MAFVEMDFASGGKMKDWKELYSASAYASTITLSESFKNYNELLIEGKCGGVLVGSNVLSKDLEIGDFVGVSFASNNIFIYGSFASYTSLDMTGKDTFGSYICKIYGR